MAETEGKVLEFEKPVKKYDIQYAIVTSVFSAKMHVKRIDQPDAKEEDVSSMGLVVSWGAKSIGFGELTLTQNADGTLEAQTENMGRDFVRAVLDRMAETVKITE